MSNRQCAKNSIRNALIIPKIKNKISTKNWPEVRVEKKKEKKKKKGQMFTILLLKMTKRSAVCKVRKMQS